MGDHSGVNGHGTNARPNGTKSSATSVPISATEPVHGPVNGSAATNGATAVNGSAHGSSAGAVEYYILCPQRDTEVPGLITHLISRDICDKRQTEHYHKCPNCVRSRLWRERNGLPVEEPATAAHG